ncbi:CONSTANS-like zinc finger protein [Quillaja saponaria]|uniref:CONSTANS-like zinc finger protein n=1 Tax=Quillaja saponaria TaxID=32244 RepID=A0AAD7KQJ5_QUISA|nr:CONSTANS-like zinc finger protein [Quillaja saponaria]
MEKVCEFCKALRPVVYCKADSAYLCLSCDSKIHLANSLSSRHLRTILCNLCRYRPAYVQCLDHQMFVCRGCDQKLHNVSFQHQKRAIRSYMGCPSAKDFAVLWGFKLDELESRAHQDQLASILCSSEDYDAVNSDITGKCCIQVEGPPEVSIINSERGSNRQKSEILAKNQEENASFIVQQILDLKMLQLHEEDNHPPIIRGQEQTDVSSSAQYTSNKFAENLDQQEQYYQDLGIDLKKKDSPVEELKVDPLPSPFSLLEHSPLSSVVGPSLPGEFFWPTKSSIQSSQLWSQNMQDLGVCEELICHDDFDIPDVDLTFRNFEELFGGDQETIRALLDDQDVSCSSLVKDTSLDKSDNRNAREIEDASAAASVYMDKSSHMEDRGPSNQVDNHSRSLGLSNLVCSSYSTMSCSVSRFSVDSSDTDCINGIKPCIEGGEPSCSSPEFDVEVRENAMMRYKEKKKSRMHEKQVQYPSRKDRAERQRVAGLKEEGTDSDNPIVTRS